MHSHRVKWHIIQWHQLNLVEEKNPNHNIPQAVTHPPNKDWKNYRS